MANTYSQMYDQIVFAVQSRENIIPQKNKEEYLELLRKFDIEYNEQYLFEWYE